MRAVRLPSRPISLLGVDPLSRTALSGASPVLHRIGNHTPAEPQREDADELAELIRSPLREHAGFKFSTRVVAESELTRSERRRAMADLRSDEFGEYVGRLRGLAALERALAAS